MICIYPLVIYIYDFLAKPEIDRRLMSIVTFCPVFITNNAGKKRDSTWGTSEIAELSNPVHVVQCVLDRARNFMNATEGWGDRQLDFQTLQIVRYAATQ